MTAQKDETGDGGGPTDNREECRECRRRHEHPVWLRLGDGYKRSTEASVVWWPSSATRRCMGIYCLAYTQPQRVRSWRKLCECEIITDLDHIAALDLAHPEA